MFIMESLENYQKNNFMLNFVTELLQKVLKIDLVGGVRLKIVQKSVKSTQTDYTGQKRTFPKLELKGINQKLSIGSIII